MTEAIDPLSFACRIHQVFKGYDWQETETLVRAYRARASAASTPLDENIRKVEVILLEFEGGAHEECDKQQAARHEYFDAWQAAAAKLAMVLEALEDIYEECMRLEAAEENLVDGSFLDAARIAIAKASATQ